MLLLLTLIFSVTTALAPPTSQIPTLSNRLLGKFSNVKQVTSELSSSPPLTPGISGGHELLFSTISRVDCLPYNYNDDPHSEIGILATYRFGHSKGTIFRTRLYTFTDLPGSKIAMRVCKLLEPPSDSPDPNMMYTEGIDFDAIPNCDVIWSSVPGQFDPDLFTYLPSLPSLVSTSAFHGTLGKSGSEVISDRTKKLMTVFDELSLTEVSERSEAKRSEPATPYTCRVFTSSMTLCYTLELRVTFVIRLFLVFFSSLIGVEHIHASRTKRYSWPNSPPCSNLGF